MRQLKPKPLIKLGKDTTKADCLVPKLSGLGMPTFQAPLDVSVNFGMPKTDWCRQAPAALLPNSATTDSAVAAVPPVTTMAPLPTTSTISGVTTTFVKNDRLTAPASWQTTLSKAKAIPAGSMLTMPLTT